MANLPANTTTGPHTRIVAIIAQTLRSISLTKHKAVCVQHDLRPRHGDTAPRAQTAVDVNG